MIRFYRTENCPRCKGVEDALKEQRAAHKVIIVKNRNDIPTCVPPDTKLPFLIDGDRIIQGSENIIDYMDELEEYKNQWYKFQSDTCYCDEEGEIE